MKTEKTERESAGKAPSRPGRGRRRRTVAVVIVLVIVVAGIGVFAWHGQPSFCGTICHVPMDGYVETYNATAGQQAKDAYGNEVSDASSMLVVAHKEQGMNCLSCHPTDIQQQAGEFKEVVTNSYTFPLKERSLSQLVEGYHGDSKNWESFCLKSGCHDDFKAIQAKTDNMKEYDHVAQGNLFGSLDGDDFNPHVTHYTGLECSDCHKAHRASVLYCTKCHSDAVNYLPKGWITYQQSQELEASPSMTGAAESTQASGQN